MAAKINESVTEIFIEMLHFLFGLSSKVGLADNVNVSHKQALFTCAFAASFLCSGSHRDLFKWLQDTFSVHEWETAESQE